LATVLAPVPAPAPAPAPAPSPTKCVYAGWKNGTTYARGAIVTDQGMLYEARRENKNRAPSTSPTDWARYFCQ